jgi:pimeloyl-ACP methyl ester carboxylesterase
MIGMATPSSTNMINADELLGREKTHIDGGRIGIAVLDDYQHAALSLADWSSLNPWASISVFHDHLAEADAVVARMKPFDVLCVMRERTPLTRDILERLPSLKLIASTAPRNASIDTDTANRRGIKVVHTGYTSAPTIELTWAQRIPKAQLIVYPDSGHGALFQYPEQFVRHSLDFLNQA